MRVGDVIGDRFQIERLASSGGMGDVYRACDLVTREPIALKLLQRSGLHEVVRFAREAEALEALGALRYPGIVRYIAHGATAEGQSFLAMEWLAGETLTERLARQPLTISETLALAARITATLGVIHRAGLVHRDLKPSNLFLVDGSIEGVTLLDFGVVRLNALDKHLTMPGTMLGTPGYMAPEQARSEPHIDARADVFSLGCVMFKCLTGRPAFQGADGLSVLIKVLLEDPPRLRELREDIPEALDDLVARMLSKQARDRPNDGDAMAAELAALEHLEADAASSRPTMSVRGHEITTNERKVMCIVLARDGADAADETRSAEEDHDRRQALIDAASLHQGQLEILESRSPLIVLASGVAPTDLAAQAARCALAVSALLGPVPVALVTGRAEISSRLPVGELIDRAIQLVPASLAAAGAASVCIDEVTAGLLGVRFDIDRGPGGLRLRGEREDVSTTQTLLGKPTPCVGRDREIALLEAAFSHCVDESTPSAVLVSAAAGAGKSRLRTELVRRLRDRGEPMEVWIGRGDPMSAGSAFGLLAHALRRAIGLFDGEPVEARQRKIQARVERHDRGGDSARVAAFLGELIGVPFPDEDNAQLRAARRSPVLMSDQLRVAWEDFLRAECAARPVLLVLEDLHWGDLPSVTLVDSALRNLSEMSLMVLALGRPEVHEIFPKLWAGRGVHEVQLSGLPRRASERLVRQALGEGVAPELVATILDRADGNAFYLEEQIRAVADGKGADLPETVLAMVQARIEVLDAEARRVLRAASVFGQTFWHGGVAALVGRTEVSAKLVELEQREVIARRGEGSLPDEVEYGFRHALVREAAYGMLTEGDRRLGHRLAGDWLERAGDGEPIALAEHFERGAQPARAAAAYLRAAEQALRGHDLVAAIERAERGVACGASSTRLGELRLAQAEAHVWRGELALAEQRGTEAVERLERGSAPWFRAVTQVTLAAGKLGGFDRVERWMGVARDAIAAEGAAIAKSICLCEGAPYLAFGGRTAVADALIEMIEADGADPAAWDVELIARLHQARSVRAMVGGDPGASLMGLEAALAAFERAGDRGNACAMRMNVGYMHGELGDFTGAEEVLRSALAAAERMGLNELAVVTLANLGHVLAYRGQLDEARRTEEQGIALSQQLGDPRAEGNARTYLAKIALLALDFEAAEREAAAAAKILQSAPPLRAAAIAVRARALLGLGRAGEALAAAVEAFSMLLSIGALEEGESLVRLVYAESLAANGLTADCATTLSAARARLLERAANISDPVWRARFLTVPDNAGTLAMAVRWLDAALG